MFEDKLALWAKEKVHHAALQEDAVKSELESKKQLWTIRLDRESALTELMKEEITLRIKLHQDQHDAEMKFRREKHNAELELIKLQKAKILKDL